MIDQPVLTIVYPPEQRRIIPIPEGKSIIGRGLDADIRLDDSLASRKHCEINRSGLSIRLLDMESTNGTFVNCTEISEVELQPFSEIEIGTTILKYEWKESAENDSTLPTLLPREVFDSYSRSIAVFSARNHLPLAALYIQCSAEVAFVPFLKSRIAKIISSEKRTSDLFTASEQDGVLEFMLLVSHLRRDEAIEETCSIRDAIEHHKFCFNETLLDINPKFGFAFADEASPDICKTLFENARALV